MAIVDVWIGAGQSNWQGRGLSAQSVIPNALALEWDEDNSLDPLRDPGVAASPYAAQSGSAFPAFLQAFTLASGRTAVAVRTAVGGTSLLEANATANGGWWPGGNCYLNSIARTQDAIAAVIAAGHTIASLNVVWHQGERDAFGVVDAVPLRTEYEAGFVDLRDRFATDLATPDLKIYVCRVGGGDTTKFVAIRDAQDAACAQDVGLVMAYTRCVDFASLGWVQADNLHYTQDGYNDMGTTAGTFAAIDFGFDPDLPPPPASTRTSEFARRYLATV